MGRGTRVTFREVFAVREFRAMWAAEALSQAGDQLARVALAILVFERTRSATLTALTYALTYVPSFLGGIFLSGLADRFPRREIMVISDLLRAVLIGLVAVPSLPFPVVYVLVAGTSFFQAPFKAAQQALLPAVLAGDLFVVGMSIRTVTVQSAQLAGFAGGGFLVNVINPYLALALDAVTFFVSALLLRLGVQRRPAATSGTTRPSFMTSLGAGAGFIFRDRGLRVLAVFGWLSGFLVVYEGLAAPYTAEIGGSTAAVGLILASDPFGSIIGALAFGRLVPPAARPKVLNALAIASCVPLLVCFVAPSLVVSVTLFALAGALGTAVLIQSNASLTHGLPDHSRAQALGLFNSGLATVTGLSPLLAGVLADQIGTAKTVGIVGVAGLFVALPAVLVWRRTFAADPDRWLNATESD